MHTVCSVFHDKIANKPLDFVDDYARITDEIVGNRGKLDLGKVNVVCVVVVENRAVITRRVGVLEKCVKKIICFPLVV